MVHVNPAGWLETKFCGAGDAPVVGEDATIAGYASLYGVADQGGDIVQKGAYAAALERMAAQGRSVKMLWQHDPATPIGVWETVEEDGRGLHVRGRILTEVQAGREALALLRAGAIDGLSIGYRVKRAERAGTGRLLHEIELWEVSLVTFPMLPDARATAKSEADEAVLATSLASFFDEASALLA